MKGAAVSSIILVIIAAVVVGTIVYNYYSKNPVAPTITETTLTDRECQSKLLTYCDLWNANGYGRDAISEGGRPGPWELYARGCDSEQPTSSTCDRVSSTSAVTGRIAEVGRLGFLEPCNINKDTCATGLICKLGRDNLYRCLRVS